MYTKQPNRDNHDRIFDYGEIIIYLGRSVIPYNLHQVITF